MHNFSSPTRYTSCSSASLPIQGLSMNNPPWYGSCFQAITRLSLSITFPFPLPTPLGEFEYGVNVAERNDIRVEKYPLLYSVSSKIWNLSSMSWVNMGKVCCRSQMKGIMFKITGYPKRGVSFVPQKAKLRDESAQDITRVKGVQLF